MKTNIQPTIYKSGNLYGAIDDKGNIVVSPQYIEMNPFSCGLSMVRTSDYQYGYINTHGNIVIPYGLYTWCDSQFVGGYARVAYFDKSKNKTLWGIINTKTDIVVPLIYDKIWALKEQYFQSLKAYKDGIEEKIDLIKSTKFDFILDGLTYISTYNIVDFKTLTHCDKIDVKKDPKLNKLFFTFACNRGAVAIKGLPRKPKISIVSNICGKIFPLLHEEEDTGKQAFDETYVSSENKQEKCISSKTDNNTQFAKYENKTTIDTDNWSDSYDDNSDFYDGWSSDEIESGLADAYECDLSAKNDY